MQYRNPVGSGPSWNTWPRWASQCGHITSVLFTPWLISFFSNTALGEIGLTKLGHPEPESYLSSELNKLNPQQTHLYVPCSLLLSKEPVNGDSVPPLRVTEYCSGDKIVRHSSSDLGSI